MTQSCFLPIVLLAALTGPFITVDALRFFGPSNSSVALSNLSTVLTLNATHRGPPLPWNPWRGGIPLRIIVTAPYQMNSDEYQEICKNIAVSAKEDSSLENESTARRAADAMGRLMQQCAISRFQSWAPPGSSLKYFTDLDMKLSAMEISKQLQQSGVVNDAYKAFKNLRPAAYRADVWRLMELWYRGGVYLDMNIQLQAKLSSWIDFDRDHLVLVKDAGVNGGGYWNAMMASTPQSPFIVEMIRTVTGNIKSHYYGNNPLCITGPIALYQALEGKHIGKHGAKLRVQYDFNHLWNDEARDIATHKHVIATKDQWLHHLRRDPKTAEVTHYSDMWYSREVYCDEQYAHPEFVPHGMCGPVKIPERNFTLPQDRRHGKLTVAD
eukprot:gnl/TRDRNA2_/TRDRNA2_175668_c0_seq19.p1 gnl/TRDRNA2_/TRDRNA2_175668_c0~~gnl/TRDRNA2_/TRDRNA2_175668_c0_seq19.p1  ORF type:complete len:382 (-),score=16.85 gnl/TRDRNA2_/TRDRNA2_175668_c0_seq19:106-1251(-)